MAKARHSTVPRIPHQADAAIGCAARDWEGKVNDLLDLADVTVSIADASLSGPGETIVLMRGQIRQLLFCIYEMSARTERFKDIYYAAIEA